ncbi:MAG: protease modulator HflC [Desulfatibacillum sp.]|nr:protease modulator HflC [Desulfatibacillum sp.]
MIPKKQLLIGILILIAVGVYSCAYVVDETEQVVITWFGRPVGDAKTTPGLKFKLPWPFHQTAYFPKNLQEWDGDADKINTEDKKLLWVDTFARWKIVDTLKFYKLTSLQGQTYDRLAKAQEKLSEIINAKVRDEITNNPLIETVRRTNRKIEIGQGAGSNMAPAAAQTLTADGEVFVDPMAAVEFEELRPLGKVELGRPEVMRRIKERVNVELSDFGIEVVDVKIKRVNYTAEVRQKAYDRMIAERMQKAEKIRSEGQGRARRIEGEMEKELKRINSEAYRTSQEIKGRADAKATTIYSQAYGKDPEFYSFMKTLDVYKQTLKKDTTIVLSTDSEFLKYFKGSAD